MVMQLTQVELVDTLLVLFLLRKIINFISMLVVKDHIVIHRSLVDIMVEVHLKIMEVMVQEVQEVELLILQRVRECYQVLHHINLMY